MTERDLTLSGLGALVTGGAGGIGGGCARWLVRDGAAVTLMGRTESSLVEVAELLEREAPGPGLVHWVTGDAGDPADLDDAVAQATRPTGRLGICVATVGGSTITPLLACSRETFVQDLERNAVSAFLAIKHAAPALAAGGGGSVVCISSDAAAMSWQFMPGYCAGKAAVEALVRAAADELGHLGVRVNAVRPGLVKVGADRHAGLFDDPAVLQLFLERKPLGRTGRPDDVGAAVRFLAGPESSWITGESLAVDGGNELRGAPRLEPVARQRVGDAAFEEALAGRIPR